MVIGKAQDDKSIRLSWKKPVQPNGTIQGYQILYYSYKVEGEGIEEIKLVLITFASPPGAIPGFSCIKWA